MSVTFFAIDQAGAIMQATEPYEVNVSNGHAVGIERALGFRAADDVDIPGGERTIDAFQTALMLVAVTGGGLGWYGEALSKLATAARQAGAEVIAWA